MVSETVRRCAESGAESAFSRIESRADPSQARRRPDARRSGRSLADIEAQRQRAFADAPGPFFALDGRWTGLHRWRGSGRSDGRLDRLTVGHGESPLAGSGFLVRVETHRTQRATPGS